MLHQITPVTNMIEIVNVNENWGIGKNGQLLVNIPEDMAFFRTTTRGSVVICGSVTLDSFPGFAPLKNRVNIILVDDDKKIRPESIAAAEADRKAGKSTKLIYVHSIEEAVEVAERESVLPDTAKKDIFVIGGASIYRIMLPYCDTCLVTINDSPREADTFFPNLRESDEWEMTEQSELHEHEGVHFRFTTWKRK